ncbi:hypothetical protein B9G99_07865 [Kushneria konosiri]|uniref:Uncharacterized protein n=1 Tax=Kushneria konosiri TaxID=698828 RepID=A0A2Z2H630_9GAMM|nr:hypothetical protein B9G99_07865 [Kushneria konosiri]
MQKGLTSREREVRPLCLSSNRSMAPERRTFAAGKRVDPIRDVIAPLESRPRPRCHDDLHLPRHCRFFPFITEG